MAKPDAELRAQIESWVAEGDVAAVFESLSAFEDLRHADQPPVSKKALSGLEQRSAAVRTLLLGLVSASPAIRGFARKHGRRLKPQVSLEPLFGLAFECIDPLKPASDGPGMLGTFGDWCSPLGQIIADQDLSQQVPKGEMYHHSPASRYVRDVSKVVVSLAGRASWRHGVALREYSEALVRSHVDHEPPSSMGELHALGVVNDVQCAPANGRPREEQEAYLEIVNGWVTRRLQLDDPWDDVTSELAERFARLRDDDRAVSRRRMSWHGATVMNCFPPPHRGRLYAAYRDTLEELDASIRHRWDEAGLKRFREQFPDEIDDLDTADSARAQREKAKREARKTMREETRRYLEEQGLLADDEADEVDGDTDEILYFDDDPDPYGEDTSGRGEHGLPIGKAVAELLAMTEELGVRSVFDAVKRLLRNDFVTYDGPPEGGYRATAEDEKLLQHILDQLVAERRRGTGTLSNEALDAADWAPELDRLLRRMVEPWLFRLAVQPTGILVQLGRHSDERLELLFSLIRPIESAFLRALRFLPERLSEAWADLWTSRVAAHGVTLLYESPGALANIYARRGTSNARLVGAMMGPGTQASAAWSAIAWHLYRRDEQLGRPAVRCAIAATPAPDGGYYKRTDCQDPYAALLYLAWNSCDLELIASAIERCALPVGGKGATAKLAALTEPRFRHNYAPVTPDGRDGVPLAEVWQRLREQLPDRAERALATLLDWAEIEELPATLLAVAARTDTTEVLAPHAAAIVDCCQASSPSAAAAALDTLARHPTLVAGWLEDVTRTLGRALFSTHVGVARAAAGLSSTLCAAYPEASDRLLALLFEALHAEETRLLETVLRELKRFLAPSKKKIRARPAALDADVAARLSELGRREPERLGRYTDLLLRLA